MALRLFRYAVRRTNLGLVQPSLRKDQTGFRSIYYGSLPTFIFILDDFFFFFEVSCNIHIALLFIVLLSTTGCLRQHHAATS